ncbi:exopolysaccharide biosynthesis polyprenyl glycosylphosphotransferase [Wenyingzhuangia sp. IMCC45533]
MPLKTKLYLSERILLLRTVDVLFLLIGLGVSNLCLNFKYINFIDNPVSTNIFVLIAFYLGCGQVFEMFSLRDSLSRFRTTKNLFVTSTICVLIYLYTPLITPVLPSNRIEILTFFLIVFIPIFLWRNFYIVVFSNNVFSKQVIVIAGSQARLKKIIEFVQLKSKDHSIYAYLGKEPINRIRGYIESISEIETLVEQSNVKEIIISLKGFTDEQVEVLNQKLIRCFELGINITSYEEYFERVTECVPEENLTKHFYRYFKMSDSHENRMYLFFLRGLDIFAAILGLFTVLFVLPFVFIGNLMGNRGGLFYHQKRVGERGETFSIVKFRSMVTTAEKNGAQWAVKNDSRVTTFGKFLRKTRIDEIPQFWNVLKGEMSLIGPRPERPEFVKELEQQIPLYAIRHAIKPGLTGWAQVMYPYASTIEEQKDKLRYDLYYIKKRNLFIDFKIVIKTINTVLYFKGQ